MRLDPFAGTRAEGTLNISETALNELLRSSPSPVNGATIEVGTDNQIVVRYGMLHASATLPAEVETGPAPRLTVTLASFMVAVGLRAALRQPYVTVSGRQVTVQLADVPPLQPLRDVWPHVRRVGLSTRRGSLQAHVVFAIDEDTDA